LLPSLQRNPLGVGVDEVYEDSRQTFVVFSVVNQEGKLGLKTIDNVIHAGRAETKGPEGSFEAPTWGQHFLFQESTDGWSRNF
jgi:hypothetical protein